MALSGRSSSYEEYLRRSVIMQWNACGLRGRLSDLRQRLFKYRFPFVLICEPNITSSFRLSGYLQLWSRQDISTSKVLLFVRRDIVYARHNITDHASNEYICVSVKHKQRVFSIIGGYIPPKARFDCRYLSSVIQSCPGPHILIGDFNAHHPLWGSVTTSKRGEQLTTFLHDEGLATIIDGSPTFLRGPTYSSSLDLAFVSRSILPSAT